jgi:hypothetical protein
MRTARFLVGKDAKARGLCALGDLAEDSESVLVGLDRPVLRPGHPDASPDDRSDDQHHEHTDDDSDHDPKLLE